MADTRNPKEVVDIGKFQPYDHPQYGPGAIREVTYIDGTVERRFFYHGTQQEGEGAPDSGYLVDTKVDPKLRQAWDQARPPGGAARTPAQEAEDRNAAELQRQRERNAALPPDQDPAYETDKERRERADARIKQQGAEAEAARQRERQEKADADAAAARNAPKPVSTNTTEPYIVQTGPDGKLITTPNPNYQGERPTRSTATVNGATYVVTVDKDGKATAAPVAGLPTEKKPGQVITINGESYWATPNADPGQPPQLTRMNPGGPQPKDNGPQMAPGMSPSEYLQLRRAWLMEQRRAGVSQKDIDAIWDQNVQEATARQNEANTAATQQNQRLSSAMSGVSQAMQTVGEINKYLPEGSDLGGRALEAFLGIQRGQAQRMGGYGPMGDRGGLTVPPSPTGPPPSSAVAAIPDPPTPGAAVGPVAAGVTATNAAAIDPSGENIQTATNATVNGTHAAMGALGVPQGQAAVSGPPARDDWRLNPGEAPVSAIPESPYDFQARIAQTPPWMLDEDTYRKAVENGLENQFWAIPKRVA